MGQGRAGRGGAGRGRAGQGRMDLGQEKGIKTAEGCTLWRRGGGRGGKGKAVKKAYSLPARYPLLCCCSTATKDCVHPLHLDSGAISDPTSRTKVYQM